MALSSQASSTAEERLREELRAARGALEREIKARERLERIFLYAVESERLRLAQMLHDTVCQSLSGIGLLYRGVETRLKPLLAERPAEIVELGAAIRYSTHEIHRLASWLRPAEVDGDTLVSALATLAHLVSQKIPCELQCPRPVRVEENFAAQQLAQIAREAAEEAFRCRGIERMTISLLRENGVTRMTIWHDGGEPGTDTEAESDAALGRELLELRASAIGASLAVSPMSEEGRTITCKLPKHC